MPYCRGALAPVITSDMPRYRDAMKSLKQTPKGSSNWRAKLGPMSFLGNDTYGDCAYAGFGHIWQVWAANNNKVLIPSTDCILDNYSQGTGFQIGPPLLNDNGAVLTQVIGQAMRRGFVIEDNTAWRMLGATAVIEPDDLTSIMCCIDHFGCCYTGEALPANAATEFENHIPWNDLSQPPSDGHCPPIVDYDYSTRTFYCMTWGGIQPQSFDSWLKYGLEAHAVLAYDWIGDNGLSPSGMSMATLDGLIRDLAGTLGAYS